ncbi:carbohydrate ABC transporter permease [Pseudonocardia sp. TRM90224]|uniref:carbohydrate ABC transporter permease n=1 Tax=Pseudonocardia sp. TRM90224 TaxID=2812678 RepID=UPI001E5CFD9E|nr:sugar ABC transporter permease [Pseudonocardia sp. TRM90224]
MFRKSSVAVRSTGWRQFRTAAGFMWPAWLGIAVFFVYPLIATVYFSFHQFDMLTIPKWFGLGNYEYLFVDVRLHAAAYNTLWLVVVMVPVKVLASLGVALLLAKLKRTASFWRAVFYLPALIPPVASTVAFVFLFNPGTGAVNTVLRWVGIEGPLWFNDPNLAKPSLVLLAVWGLGDWMIILLAAVLDVPQERHEAAQLDGANALQRFRHVTLPGISPVLLFTALVGVIQTLQYFTQAAVAGTVASGQATVGQGRTKEFGYPADSTLTYPMWLYDTGFSQFALGYASALAVVLFVFSLLFTVILLRRFRAYAAEGSVQ